MFELSSFSEEDPSSWLAEFACNVLMALGIKRTYRVKNFLSFIACGPTMFSVIPVILRSRLELLWTY
jgi:hypothetical protein